MMTNLGVLDLRAALRKISFKRSSYLSIATFWAVMPCGLLFGGYQRSRGTLVTIYKNTASQPRRPQ